MALIPCRVTTNIVGARAGEYVNADPEDPQTALWIEKGYLVPDAVAESGDSAGGEGDADESLGPLAAVVHDAEPTLEPISDGVDESSLASA